MKATVTIDDRLMARVKDEAARTGRTVSELVETTLRKMLPPRPPKGKIGPLPTFDSGGALVDLANRATLDRAIGGD